MHEYEHFIVKNQRKWERKNRIIYSESEENIFVWHSKVLDSDHKLVLEKYVSATPSKICDLGTCSGEQAIEMAKLGHSVIGTDVSRTALKHAKKNALQYEDVDITFIRDDVLESNLESEQFDLIVDRGCFHSFYNIIPAKTYIDTVKRLLKPGGVFMVKVMSSEAHIGDHFDFYNGKKHIMPYRFNSSDLVEVFNKDFEFLENWQSVFQTENLDQPAAAEVAIFRKQNEK